MAKVRLQKDAFLPMPVCLVGANVEGKANFQAAAWFTQVNFQPVWVAVSLAADHHTTKGIGENGSFSLCFPSRDLVVQTDYCGLVSGRDQDKSSIFKVFYGELGTAPMADDCPFCLELRMVKQVELEGDTLFIGEVVAAYGEEGLLSDGVPDPKRMELLFLTMPQNKYWILGDEVADAYSVGRTLIKE